VFWGRASKLIRFDPQLDNLGSLTRNSRASFAFLPLRLFRHTPLAGRNAGPPGLPCNQIVRHAMVTDPEEANIFLPVSSMLVLTYGSTTPSSFPTSHLRGSIPSNLRLTARLLAVLRLKLFVATQTPRTYYPVDGQPDTFGSTAWQMTCLNLMHSTRVSNDMADKVEMSRHQPKDLKR